MRTTMLLVAIGLVGCTSDHGPNPNKPTPPVANDPAFTIQGLKNWYLIGDAVTPGDDTMTIQITAPAGTQTVDAYVGDLAPIRMVSQNGGFALQHSLVDVPASAAEILFAADGDRTAFASASFNRSAVYYVLVSTDYDFSDPGTQAIQYMDWMHRDHPEMRITHFWAPYTYTDPVVTDPRRAELDTWIHTQRDMHHDEIGLHIHPYCTFVVDAGLTCVTDQSTVYPAGDTTGYTIKVAAYGHDNFGILLRHAFDLFAQHGLGKPVTFRAGGWTADLNTLLALADNGFVADTSALNWARIEEWQGKELYTWNMTNWAPINDTSQPYWPSRANVLPGNPGPDMSLLEVPDNGVMIDYVTTAEMTGIFDANWDGTPFAGPRTLMMGFHPATGFTPDEYTRVQQFLAYADKHLASHDLGPVVYTTLSDVTPAFPPSM
jgi:hypothetical protein